MSCGDRVSGFRQPGTGGKKLGKLWTRDFVLIFLSNLSVFMGFQMIFPTLPLYVEYLGGDETNPNSWKKKAP